MTSKDPDLQVLTSKEVRGRRRHHANDSRSERRARSGCLRLWISMTFSAIGVIAILVVYLVGCAIIFTSIESDRSTQDDSPLRNDGYLQSGHNADGIVTNSNDVLSLEVQEKKHLREARELRQQLVEHLWRITEELNILYKDNWTTLADREVVKFQKNLLTTGLWKPEDPDGSQAPLGSSMDHRRNEIQVVMANAEREANSGKPDGPHDTKGFLRTLTWNFFSSFLYSLSLVTTVGYPHQVPQTNMGKILTMICALLGIPLLLIYLAIVGNCLAGLFTRFYGSLCCKCCLHRSQRMSSSRDEFDLSDFDSATGGGGSVTSSTASAHPMRGQPRGTVGLRKESSGLHHVAVSSSTSLNGKDRMTTSAVARQRCHDHHRIPSWILFTVLMAYVSGCACVFSAIQGWPWLDSLFFCFTLLATIGFVDVPMRQQPRGSPRHEIDELFVILCTLYLLLGLALLAMCVTIVLHHGTEGCWISTIISSLLHGGRTQGAPMLLSDHKAAANLGFAEGAS